MEGVEDAVAADQAGAGRIELCARLDLDGLTPDDVTLRRVIEAVSVPVHVMIRPRAGDFVADAAAVQLMREQIDRARDAGADGLVFGLLVSDAGGGAVVDTEATARLVQAAGPVPVTFHRAFDRVDDPGAALEMLIDLGVVRVLTSGGAHDAVSNLPVLARLVDQAGARLTVMPGGGVRARNAARILRETGARELHSSTAFDVSAVT